MEDRVITVGGPLIDKDTINPATQKRYGYLQAVLTAINEDNGILTFKKAGSVRVTPDKEYVTPSNSPFTVGRYLVTGARFLLQVTGSSSHATDCLTLSRADMKSSHSVVLLTTMQ
jgi:hypothetical protein